MAELLDLTKLVRRTKALRAACPHHYIPKRNGVQRCEHCGDQFPCRDNCIHLDCIERAIGLGLRKFPRDYPVALVVTESKGSLDVVVIDTTDDDPLEWVTP